MCYADYRADENFPFTAEEVALKEKLSQKLLAFGGDSVAWSKQRTDLSVFLDKGRFFHEKARQRINDSYCCHINAARIWGRDVKRYEICLGFALNQRGCWVPHCWLLDVKGIIETEEVMVHYYGIELDPCSAADFWEDNFVYGLHSDAMDILADGCP